jgi:hypothetical protein
MAVTSLHHVAIRVQDPDRSLGLSFLELPVGPEMTTAWRGSPSEGTMLATQAGDTFVILAPPLEGTPDDDRFSERRIGIDHLAFASTTARRSRSWSGVCAPRASKPPASRPTRFSTRSTWPSATRQRAVGVLYAVKP